MSRAKETRGVGDDATKRKKRVRGREREREGGGDSVVPKTGNGSSTGRNTRGKVSAVKIFSPRKFSTTASKAVYVLGSLRRPCILAQEIN